MKKVYGYNFWSDKEAVVAIDGLVNAKDRDRKQDNAKVHACIVQLEINGSARAWS